MKKETLFYRCVECIHIDMYYFAFGHLHEICRAKV